MQLAIISGKGGTGKTTISSSLAYLSKNEIKVDCDVDAPNLQIILKGKDIQKCDFYGAKIATIDEDLCLKCGSCLKTCKYDAIKDFKVNELLCEGCGACRLICKAGAISLEDEITGDTYITKTKNGILSRAEMKIGAEGSGKLVSKIRENAMKYKSDDELIILDGSPGVGCSVIASVTGCDLVLVVTEPTQSGYEDFHRVLSLCKFLDLEMLVCINKYNVNEIIARDIEGVCNKEGIELIGQIPFDSCVKKSINERKPIVSYEESKAGIEIRKMWKKINKIMEGLK